MRCTGGLILLIACLNHSCHILSEPEVTLFTDASSLGWGGVLDKVNIGGRWTPSEANHRINYLEMLAVFFALKAFQTQLCGKHVCIRIDNMTAVSDIGKMGTSHSRKRNNLTREIWNWCINNYSSHTRCRKRGSRC